MLDVFPHVLHKAGQLLCICALFIIEQVSANQKEIIKKQL